MIDEEKSKLTSGKFDTSLVEIIESPSSDEGRVVELPSISRKSTNSERQMAFEQALVILSERSEGLSNNDAVKCLDFFDVLYCKEDGTDNGFRHQYASIFDVMSGSYNAEKNDPDFAPTETMDHLSESIGFIQQSMPQSLSPDFQKKFGKLVDHINLEYKKLNYIIRQNRLQQESIEGSDKQFNNTIRLQQQRMELLSKRIYEKENQIDRMQREYIAILGIFAAVVIAMNGSIVFTSNMSRALSRDKFGQTPCFSGPGLIIWPASLPRWTCLDRRASSQSNIRGFAGRAAAASDRRGSPPRALYVAGVASQFVATAGGVTFGLKSLPAGVPREQRPRE